MSSSLSVIFIFVDLVAVILFLSDLEFRFYFRFQVMRGDNNERNVRIRNVSFLKMTAGGLREACFFSFLCHSH